MKIDLTNKEKKPSAIPGFALIGLFIVGIIAAIRGLDEPRQSIAGTLYLFVSTLVFGFILSFCFKKER